MHKINCKQTKHASPWPSAAPRRKLLFFVIVSVTWFPSVSMASVNGEQCKVLDIKFHAFQIPTFFLNVLFILLIHDTSWRTGQGEDHWTGIRKRGRGFFLVFFCLFCSKWNVDENRIKLGSWFYSLSVTFPLNFLQTAGEVFGTRKPRRHSWSGILPSFLFLLWGEIEKRREAKFAVTFVLSEGLWIQGSWHDPLLGYRML